MLTKKEIKSLIDVIKKKPELSSVTESLVKNLLINYLEKYSIKKINKRDAKLIVKEVRAHLRNYVGRFHNSIKKLKNSSLDNIENLLMAHQSTKERVEDQGYDMIIPIIEEKNPKSIVDLGCGINPIAIFENSSLRSEYYAYDIDETALNLVIQYFKLRKINGKIISEDVRKINKFPKADLCLIFKLLDLLEPNRSKETRKLFEKTDCNNYIISFPTKTISGRPMKQVRRFWFENLLNDLNLSWTTKRIPNELFYIINNSQRPL